MSMNQELKKILVARIKQVMPKGWKATFKVINHSELQMTVKSAPYELSDLTDIATKDYASVNCFHLYSIKNEKLRVELEKITEAMQSEQRIVTEDADYGSVPNYYIDLRFGSYEKPFVSTKEKLEEKLAA